MDDKTREYVVKELADFFLDELKRDAAGTADWVAQGAMDVDEFIAAVKTLSGVGVGEVKVP